MSVIKIGVTGAAGKMGQTLIREVAASEGLKLTAAIEHPGSSMLGVDAGELAGVGHMDVAVVDDLSAVVGEFDVLIDFTIAAATVSNMEICAAANRNMIIGTTGLDDPQIRHLHVLGEHMAVVFAPNFSVGVNASFRLLQVAAAIFGDSVDIEILETHHRQKVDAPSGTALTMGKVIADTLGRDLKGVAIHGRVGHTGARKAKTIGFHSVRAGDVVGEHTVVFAGQGERLEITHRAHSRLNFAEGALRAAVWVMTQPKGIYNMQDVLGLSQAQ